MGDFGAFGSSSSGRSGGRDGDSEYIRLSDRISTNITKINSNANELKRYLNQLGTRSDNSRLRDTMSSLQKTTAGLVRETNSNIQQLSYLDGGSDQEKAQRRMQQEKLKSSFKSAISSFHTVEQTCAKKEKETVERMRAASISGSLGDDDEDDRLLGGRGRGYVVHQQEEVDVQAIEERADALRQLENDILDVNEIFRDLGAMVHEQGEVIDTIEGNVEHAAVDVENANDQLRQALHSQIPSCSVCDDSLCFALRVLPST
ncbi:syntaxin-7-like isoform X2 [Sycon ciliatum]|uniref:syntaxin-7-like isoform X2 n=1 Tax=Sycon ciliatum TaxID=27933 RepID=UPI0020AE22D8